MSDTWVIKDNAPVDDASLTLATTNISFTTNNQKATSIGIIQDGLSVVLSYGGIGAVAQFDLGVSPAFEWYSEAYRTLEFDTATTGELLAWLQKNADMQDKTYLTTTSELKSTADAIRAKAGTREPLVWPDGFITAISGIETGGGDSAGSVIDKSVTSITSNAAEVGQYAFCECEMLETASFPMATKIQGGAFIGCKALVSVSAPNVKEIRSDVTNYFMFDMDGNYEKGTIGAFSGCTSLATVDFPLAETIYSSAFKGCAGLTELKFPRVKIIGASYNAGGGGILE